jgi:predicted dienelactone hydrolase
MIKEGRLTCMTLLTRFSRRSLALAALVIGCSNTNDSAQGAGTLKDAGKSDAAPATEASLTSPGPYAVATRTFTFVDSTRSTPANGTYVGAPDRTLPTRVWYPADGTNPDGSASATPSRDGPFPVILYAHGFLSTGTDVVYLKAHLASHGYIVIAPEFPLSNGAAPGGPTIADVASQPGDLAFVAGEVSALKGADESLAGALDTSREGVAGLSLGGATTLIAVYHPTLRLPNVKAAVAYAPVACAFTRAMYQHAVPTVIMGGSADELVPLHTIEETTLKFAPPPLTLVKLIGGTHIGFTGIDSPGATNSDQLACGAVQGAIGCTVPASPDLATKLDEGVVGGAFNAAGCGPVCGETFTQTMRATRQVELVKAVTLAQFEAILRGREDAALYLREGLAKTATDVAVMKSGSPGAVDPTGVSDGSQSSCGTTMGGVPDGGACNSVVNDAPVVSPTLITGALPVGMGGPIVEGTYFLTKYETNTSIPTTLMLRVTVVIAGSTLQVVQEFSGGAPTRTTFTMATSGNQITLTPTCRSGPPDTSPTWTSYTATPASYTLYAGQAGVALTWTKQ